MQYNITEITELNIDELDSVNGGALTGEGIAAGIGTFAGGLGGTYFGLATLALGPGLVAGAAGAAVFGIGAYALYRTAKVILE